jgi:chromosome segregation ATPase
MNNDDKALMKDIADDLNKKSLEELIYINFNPEHYVNEFTSDGRKANENLLNEVKELNRQYEEKKSQYESIKSNIENCKAQYEQKENELKNLYQQKQNIESNVTVEKLIQELGNYIQQNFQQPKQQLINDFMSKKIDFETFKNQFKDLTLKYHYYSIIKDKLNLCK